MKFYDVVMKVFNYYNGERTFHTTKPLSHSDRALRILFEMYPDEISGLMENCLPQSLGEDGETYPIICGYFCKSFRQMDIINYKKGHMDMVFWNLINNSDILDKVFKRASEWNDRVIAGETPEKAFEYIKDEYL
jgi:hypothetical protein